MGMYIQSPVSDEGHGCFLKSEKIARLLPMNQSIQMLPDHVINQIAAGEVIERPASVMKELMENAFDANSTQIDVEVVCGGMQLISVSDNGHGMSRDDAMLSIERHATSKIQTVEQIEAVATLGFRGEALAAISAVSRLTLTTRPAAELSGTEIRISGGKLQDITDAGCPPGTCIAIRNLFFNVPARRKFLRTETTELAQLRQLFAVYALAHPEVGLSFTSDNRELHNLPGDASLSDRIAALYDPSFLSNLRALNLETDGVKITGFTGLPQTGKKNRSDQYIFVNGRPASAPIIYHALNEAYHAVLAHGRHPAVFLFIDPPPAMVDVNVHPAKKEVRFRHPTVVQNAVIRAVKDALSLDSPDLETPSSVFNFDDPLPAPRVEKQRALSIQPPEISERDIEPFAHNTEHSSTESVAPEKRILDDKPSPWKWCRVLGQVGKIYAVLETEDGVVMINPQAAHERVLFEKFMNDLTAKQSMKQGLLAPETIKLLPTDAEALRHQLPLLSEMGFGISDFDQDTFLVDALPVHLQDASPSIILSEIASALKKCDAPDRAAHEALRETVAQAACRSSIKTKDILSIEAIEHLVADLSKTEMPYTCPHGRPTLIFTSFTELNRKFGK